MSAELNETPVMETLEKALCMLSAKGRPMSRLWDYYDGKHPLVFTSEKLQAIFQKQAAFSENWCQIIVDAVLERLVLEGFSTVKDKAAQDSLKELYENTYLELESVDIHKAALVCGESFLVVDWNDEEKRFETYYNDPKSVTVSYEELNPRLMSWAAKWWKDEKSVMMTIYTKEVIKYFRALKGKDSQHDLRAQDFKEYQPAQMNTWGRIPVFHFRRELRGIHSILNTGVLRIQDAANKVLSDTMVTSEFTGFQQRWVIGNVEMDEGRVRQSPGSVLLIPGAAPEEQQVQTGTYQPSELTGLVSLLEHFASAIGGITGIPKHYFFKMGDAPSGEALIAMEAQLTQKVKQQAKVFGVTWREVMAFLLSVSERKTTQQNDIVTLWAPAQTVQPLTQAQVRQTNQTAGIPIVTQLRDEGWSDEELDEMRKDKMDEQVASAGSTTGPAAAPATQALRKGAAIQTAEQTAQPAVGDAIKNAVKGGVEAAKVKLERVVGTGPTSKPQATPVKGASK